MKNIRIALFLSRRFLTTFTQEKSVKTMFIICFTSIMISSFGLALIAAIMNGFETKTYNVLKSIHYDITIHSPHNQALAFDRLERTLIKEFGNTIKTIAPLTHQHVLIQNPHDKESTHIVTLKALDPHRINADQKLYTTFKQKNTLNLLANNHLILGSDLAQTLQADHNTILTLLYNTEAQTYRKKITFDTKELPVGGLFHTGIETFDSYTILCSHKTLQELFPEAGIKEVGINLKPNYAIHKILPKLKNRFNLNVTSWHDLYKPLMEALTLEKYAMIVILSLVALISSMNIIALLFMHITQKKGTIAILQAMGSTSSTIRTIFIMLGMMMSCFAGFCGLTLATVSSWIIDSCKLIKLPDAYFTSHLPSHMTPHIFILVAIIILMVSLCATWFATQRIKTLSIAQIVKSEA